MKTKRFLSVILVLCMVMTMLPMGTLATEDVPQLVDGYYEIYTADQLYWFAAEVNSGNKSINGKLMADIVINENVLTTSGTLNGDGSNLRPWTVMETYSGIFDGNGKVISGIYHNDETVKYGGVFGVIGKDAAVQNLGIVDSYLTIGDGSGYLAGIAGYNFGSIDNCYNQGTIVGTVDVSSSGIACKNDGVISNCYNSGNILGSWIGGLVVENYGTVEACYNTRALTAEGSYSGAGGVVVDNKGVVKNCYNTAAIMVNSDMTCYAAGIVSCNAYDATISNCYNIGTVSIHGGYYDRSLYAIAGNGIVTNCYYLEGCCIWEGKGTAMTAQQFASGKVCWLLSGSPMPVKAMKNADENPWGQKIGVDAYPGFSDDKVIPIVDEGGNVIGLMNAPAAGVTVSGTVTSFLEGDATVELVQDGEVLYSTTASGGSYAIEGVVAGNYTLRVTKANHAPMEFAITVGDEAVTQDAAICPVGDVTGDGVVNIKDFQRLLRHVNKTNPLEGYELACGDVTGDGTCNIKDFQRLLRHVNKTNPLF